MTERRYAQTRATPALTGGDDEYATPCKLKPEPFDVLMDVTAGPGYRAAVRAAHAMCLECKIRPACHAENQGEGWLRSLTTSGTKRDPSPGPSCGKARGVEQHRRRNEFPCGACRDAYNTAQRAEKKARRDAKRAAA